MTLLGRKKRGTKEALAEVKEESEKAGLKLNIQKTKIMASGPIEDLGGLIYNLRTNGKNGNRIPAGQPAPKYNHKPPSVSKDWSFVVALSSEGTITKMKCSKRPIHPQHSFIYCLGWKNILCLLVFSCQERKAGLASRKPDCLYSFLSVTRERKGKVRSAVWLGHITLC